MYAQYQQYQHQNSNQQQQQQQAVSGWSSQGGQAQWNGSSWVYPNNNPQQQQKQQIIPPDPVQTFTQYYHGWTKREEELKKQVIGGRTEVDRQTAESNRKWAKYYAEESSRAAHHFHQYPQATSAPFDLPPAPPPQESAINNHNITNTNTKYSTSPPSVKSSSNTQNKKESMPGRNTGSVTRYVKRNITRSEVVKDQVLKAYVQSQVEKEIAAAIQKGDLQSRNWDLEPLILLPNQKATAATSTKSSNGSSASMKRYVERNVARSEVAKDSLLKAYVQSQVEKKIAAAIQKGDLETKNWDLEPLILLPSEKASSEVSKQAPFKLEYSRYYEQEKHSIGGGNYNRKSPSVSPENRNDGNSSSRVNRYDPASTSVKRKFSGEKAETNESYYGPSLSHKKNSVYDSQYKDHSKEISYNTASSFHSTGINKKGKRPNHQNKEDFIALGNYYGPSSSWSPEYDNTRTKKSKKWHRKNSVVPSPTTAVVTMQNDGMDYSEEAMDKRANRFSGRGGIHEATIANFRSSHWQENNRKNDKYMGKGTITGAKKVLDETDYEQMTVKGTSTTLEKEYLRLTAPPRAEFVRPFHILKQHLRNLQGEYFRSDDRNTSSILQERMKTPQGNWKLSVGDGSNQQKSQNPQRKHDYLWFCSQLKAIRQDCTVQRIQGGLAVDVYETHARIALQEGDLNEYNQCQTQLKDLYDTCPTDAKDGFVQEKDEDNSFSFWKNQEEFIAYRLLYYVFLSTNEKYSGGSSDMFHIMLSLTPKERNHPAIRHALNVREAVASSDYNRFFRLYKSSPNLGFFLTDLLVPTMRMRGLRRIAKAYRPSIELSVCLQYLGFCCGNSTWTTDKNDDDSGKIDAEGRTWLISCGGIVQGSKFVTKDSIIHAPDTETTKNSLI